MSSVADWLDLHCFDDGMIVDCLVSIESGHLHLELDGLSVEPNGSVDAMSFSTIQDATVLAVCPALSEELGIELGQLCQLGLSIRWTEVEKDQPPQTIDNGVDHPPEIRVAWENSTSDLVCLAHEFVHALQLQLSAGSFMPPVARETCAFLGELSLISWARRTDPDLAAILLHVWRKENERYFGDDVALLRSALAVKNARYNYRMNYPLARAAAVVLFRSRADRLALFKSGSEAMALMPLEKIADLAGQPRNHLPPFPLPDTTVPALDAYRALGAIALLDIHAGKGASERRIEGYYASLLGHLQERTAFIELDEVRRPVAYATWCKATEGKPLTVLRQAAPFGHHLFLQRALQRHLGHDHGVEARHERSARAEQTAW